MLHAIVNMSLTCVLFTTYFENRVKIPTRSRLETFLKIYLKINLVGENLTIVLGLTLLCYCCVLFGKNDGNVNKHNVRIVQKSYQVAKSILFQYSFQIFLKNLVKISYLKSQLYFDNFFINFTLLETT